MPEIEHLERSKLLHHRITLLSVIGVFSFSISFSQILENKKQHGLLLQGIHYTLLQEYDSAETVFRSMITEFPNHPSGYLYLAGMFQAKFIDYGDRFNERQYDSLLTAATKCSEKIRTNKKDEVWGNFYIGMAEAFRSFTASENGNLPRGFYYGVSAANAMERCLAADSTFGAAKNILGTYYYWRSKLSWIPFVSDRSGEGIRLVLESYSHPYEKHLASQNLMLIFIDEKKFSEAEKYGIEMLRGYPDNRSFLWNLMTVYEQSGNNEKLENICDKLLTSALQARVVNHYTEATCRLKLAYFANQRNEKNKAREQCKLIVALTSYQGKTKGNLKKKIEQAEELLSSLNAH